MATDTKIILKRSNVTGAGPNSNYLEFGELAFNYRDQKLYYRTYDIDGVTEKIENYDFQRVVPISKGGTGATTAGQAILNLGAAPIFSPAFLGTPALAAQATQPTTSISSSDAAAQRALATVAYVRAEIADDAPTKTGGGASGNSWNIGILGNAATATRLSTAKTISQGTASDINFNYTFDGNSNITPNLTINSARASNIQTALSLVPGTHIQAFDADLKAIAELPGTSGFLKKTAANFWALDTEVYTPTSRTITITTGNGIQGGSAQSLSDNRTWTLGLTDTGVLPPGTTSTFNDNATSVTPFTIDAKGRIVTAGSAVTITPHFNSITDKPQDLAGYGILDALNTSATGQTKAGSLTASSFIRAGGFVTEFLKADGSVDNTAYTPISRTLTIANGTGITGGSSTAQSLADNRAWTLGLTGQALNLHNLATDGFFVRSTSGSITSVVARSIVAANALDITITNGNGVSGNPTIALTPSNLTSLRGISTAGFLTRTGNNTLTPRSIAVSGIGLSIAQPDGSGGNPTISSNATNSNTPSTLVARDASGNFSAAAITGSSFIVGTGGNSITLSGTATTTSKVLTLPDKTDTIATLNDIPDHSGATAASIPAANGRVLSAIVVNNLGHTTSVSFKELAAVDIPDLPASKITSGTFDAARITDASVTGKLLTGLGSIFTASQIAAGDTILQAFNKLQGSINVKANSASPTFTGTVTLPQGTASAAPLRFVLGTSLTTPVAGAVEFNGTNLFITNSANSRKTLAYTDSNVASATTATTATRLSTAKTISQGTASDINFSYTFDGNSNITPNLTLNGNRASEMRSTLGLAIGTNVQAWDADLDAIAALADGSDSDSDVDVGFLRKTGANQWMIDQNLTPPGLEAAFTISGDVTGSSIAPSRDILGATLATANDSPGTYNSGPSTLTPFTVDAKGRVTGRLAEVPISIAWESITNTPNTLAGYGLTGAAQALNSNLTSISTLGVIGANGLLRRNADNSWSFDTTAYVPPTRALTIAGAANSGITVTPSTATNLGADRSWSISLATGNLTQLRDLGTNTGIISHNGTTGGGMVTRSIVSANLADITITNGNGVGGDPTIALTPSNLTSLRALSTTGLVARTGANTVTSRSIAVSGTGLSISNGDGVLGNPTIALSSASLNINNSLVARDASGGFAAGTITAITFRAAQGIPSGGSSTCGYAFSSDGDTGLFSQAGPAPNGIVSLYSNGVERLRTEPEGIILSGVPTAPTALFDTNTSQIATTAYVLGQAANTTPVANGTSAIGTSLRYARADHVHPTDTSRAPLVSPSFVGAPTAPTPPQTDNSTRIATTEYVRSAVSSLINGAPDALNTLDELAAALADDANYATTITTALGAKAPLASPLFTGNVGIGMSTTPAAKLEILGGTANDSSPELRITGSSGWIDFHNSAAAGNYNQIVSAGDKTIIFTNGTNDTGNLVIAPWSNSASGIKITAAGNVGIGTSSPVTPLDIASAGIRVNTGRAISGNANDGGISLHGGTNGNGANIELYGGSHTGSPNMAYFDADTMYFRGVAGTSEYMRIASTGNVGIGTNAPGIKLDVASNGTIARFSGSGSEWQGVVIRPTDSSATVGRGGFVDFQNESQIALSSIHSYHNTDGSSDIRLLNTPTGGRTSDRRAERIRITGAGKTLIGGTSALGTRFGTNNITPNIQLLSNATGGTNLNDSSSMLFGRFSNDADGSKLFFAKTRGTPTDPRSATAVVNSGDHLGWLSFGGYDSSNIVEAARVEATVDTGTVVNATAIVSGKRYKIASLGNTTWSTFGVSGTAAVGTVFTATAIGSGTSGTGVVWEEPATGSVPGALTFSTTSLSSTAPTERMRINRSGNVGIGTMAPGARLDVVGPTLTLATPSTYAMWIGNTGGGSGDLAFASDSTNAFIQSWGGKPLIINGQGNSVGIGKAPTSALDVNGTVKATTFSGSGASLTGIPNSATTATNNNNASTIVARDGSGNFSASTITATLNGNATSANKATLLANGGVSTGFQMAFHWSGQAGQPNWVWGGNDNDPSNKYVWNPSNFSVNYANSAGSAGNSATATLATKGSTLAQGGGNGAAMTFNWVEGSPVTPAWLWGGWNGTDMYVYSPSKLNVAYADRADNAYRSDQLQAYTADNFTNGDHYVKAIRDPNGWGTRLKTSYYRGGSTTNDVQVGYADGSGNGAKAWVNFNGSGTVSIRSSYNVSSITDNGGTGGGNYTVVFSTAMPDANYATLVSAGVKTGTAADTIQVIGQYLTTGVQVALSQINTSSTRVDSATVCVAVFR